MNDPELNHQASEPDSLEPEFKQCLAQWKAPVAPRRLEAQVRASYRKQFPQPPWWQRWWNRSIRVPLPVAVTAGLVVCVMSWVAARQTSSVVIQPVAEIPQTKIVEVPVIQEKLVTRVILKRPKPSRQGPKVLRSSAALRQSPEVRDVGLPIDLAGLRPVSEIKISVNHGGQSQ